ncbi:RDD family protein [Alkalicoccus urumqiensis]|uniref:RDD family protein n=1 Tax=Alkalicoccus urumqiensis TaxID=1548213 RepID=A0A2P6MHN1_ALKUR|nr:RDD family protein [Alkalicoccus urumqiensis]PRO65794.1 RDD family protein [Alkalicoccus urumqiensis]
MDVKDSVGFWRRLGAVILDGLAITFVIVLVSFLIYGRFASEERAMQMLEGIISLGYYLAVPVIWTGYTLGKRALGIRIVKMNGSNVGILTMVLRWTVGGIVYAITLGIGVIVSIFMVALRKDNRAIHDFIAGTYVTSRPPEKR